MIIVKRHTIFFLLLLYRVVFGLLGTVIGAVLSIIVWEIARGNPYGIAVLTFFAVFIPFEYLLIVSRIYEFLAIMTLYAYLMVNNNRKVLWL